MRMVPHEIRDGESPGVILADAFAYVEIHNQAVTDVRVHPSFKVPEECLAENGTIWGAKLTYSGRVPKMAIELNGEVRVRLVGNRNSRSWSIGSDATALREAIQDPVRQPEPPEQVPLERDPTIPKSIYKRFSNLDFDP